MKLLRPFIIAGLLLCGLALPAEASLVRVCSPDRAGAALGPRPVTAPSGTVYNTNSRGCTLASQADALGLVSALGFVFDPPVAYVTAATTSTGFSPIRLPAGAYIDSITVREMSGSFVTGGLKFGTSAGGSQVAFWGSGQVVGGALAPTALVSIATGTITTIPDVSMLKRAFSSTVPQDIHFDTQGKFEAGSAVDIMIHYSFF